MENTNCLENLQCPNCASLEPLHIVASAEFKMGDDGDEGHSDIEWDENAPIRCGTCDHAGTVKQFQTKKFAVPDPMVARLIVYLEAAIEDQESGIADGTYDDPGNERLDGLKLDLQEARIYKPVAPRVLVTVRGGVAYISNEPGAQVLLLDYDTDGNNSHLRQDIGGDDCLASMPYTAEHDAPVIGANFGHFCDREGNLK